MLSLPSFSPETGPRQSLAEDTLAVAKLMWPEIEWESARVDEPE
jgi:hypothetical protein